MIITKNADRKLKEITVQVTVIMKSYNQVMVGIHCSEPCSFDVQFIIIIRSGRFHGPYKRVS